MPAPACRVLAGTLLTRLCVVENKFDPTAHPGRRFGFLPPDWFQHFQHQRGIDRAHRQITDDRADVCRERSRPLFAVPGIAPSGLMCGDIGRRTFVKCRGPGTGDALDGDLRPALLYRVDTVADILPAAGRQLTRPGQANIGIRPQAHVPRLAVPRISKNPSTRAAGRDAKIESRAVAVEAGFSGALNGERR